MDFSEFSGDFHIIKVHQIVKIFKSIAGGLGKVFEKTFLIETCYNVLRQLLRMSPKITYQSKRPTNMSKIPQVFSHSLLSSFNPET